MTSKLYEQCPACHGTGTLHNATSNTNPTPHSRACLSCKPLRVVETGMTAGQAERLAREHASYREKLRELAQGCKRRQQEYGIPNARTCGRCGVGGECVFGEEGKGT